MTGKLVRLERKAGPIPGTGRAPCGERMKAGRIIRHAATERRLRWDQALVQPCHASMSVSQRPVGACGAKDPAGGGCTSPVRIKSDAARDEEMRHGGGRRCHRLLGGAGKTKLGQAARGARCGEGGGGCER